MDNLDTISSHIVQYYADLYNSSSEVVDLSTVDDIIPCLVTDADNSFLTQILGDKEIKVTIFSMDPYSPPSPKDFGGIFFQNCWDIISRDIIYFVKHFFTTLWLYPNVNSNFITLILKVTGASQISQFQLITL